MQYTTHYNLNLPEGTDIVNPLVQDNPNYTAIDNAMYANKLRVIGSATELATGTVHAITRADTDIPAFKFIATADYNTGDTFTVDGVSVTARLADGTTPKNKAYLINSTVLAILDGTILNFFGISGEIAAVDVSYDNTSSGLLATDTQNAIDETLGKIGAFYSKIIYPETMINNIDLNNVISTGVYRLNGSITNSASGNYGVLVVFGVGSTECRQIQMTSGNNNIYTRIYSTGTGWTNWSLITMS